jgi:RimJ/RimL family protein N-acetyltransferase
LDKSTILIKGERIYLKILTVEYATEKYSNWLNDPETTIWLETKKTTVDCLKSYIQQKFDALNCLFFGIFLKTNNEHIGNVKLEPIDWKAKTSMLGILIGEKRFWGKDIASEVYKYLLRWAFDELGLESITASVYKQAIKSISAGEKVGFRVYDEVDNILKVKLLKKNFISY